MDWTSVDPSNGQRIRTYEETSAEEVDRILDAAVEAQSSWRRTTFRHRTAALSGVAERLRGDSRRWGELMAREMGKPLRDGIAEAEKCAWVCDYYAERAESQLAPEVADTPDEDAETFVAFEPLGVVLAVMPWNFPFWQVFRFAAPALMAGNGAILKHAPNVPGCALAIERIIGEAGFPEGLFRSVLVDVETTGRLIEDPRVRAATLTGSVSAGKSVAARAGASVKKTVLELGGSDPYLILEDADIAAAARTCVASRLVNSGQSCIAAKRFVVVEPAREEFEARVVDAMRSVTMGDPLDESTDIGPQAREDLRDALHEQVIRSVQAGARLLLGGDVPERPGAWYPPTVLTGVGPGMAAYEEELFGPVAAIVPVRDQAEAIRVANDTRFGLGAAVFTGDRERGRRIALEELEAGACFVNAFVRSDPRLPFGGTKESGYGRELSVFGIREFVNVKTVWVE